MDEIAALLRDALARRGWEQWRFAQKMHRDPATVSRWLAAKQAIPAECLVRATRILHAPEILEHHPIARAMAESNLIDLTAIRAERAAMGDKPELVIALRFPDGTLHEVEQGAMR